MFLEKSGKWNRGASKRVGNGCRFDQSISNQCMEFQTIRTKEETQVVFQKTFCGQGIGLNLINISLSVLEMLIP